METTRRLAELIEKASGNVVSEGQYPYLQEIAQRRARERGLDDLELYVQALARGGMADEWRRLLPEITIKESFLFRIPEQFRALREELLPRLGQARPADHRLRFWSAGCARGEEPATLALVLAESSNAIHRDWEIVATDLDEEALAEARRGEYGERAVAQVPEHLLREFFEHRGKVFVLRQDLRQRIDYRSFNLISSSYLNLGSIFDVIFLRNVLIYFNPTAQRDVVHRIVKRLAPDGYLFLGHSESMWQLSEEMETVELDGCFAYRPKPAAGRRRAATAVLAAAERKLTRPKSEAPQQAAFRGAPEAPPVAAPSAPPSAVAPKPAVPYEDAQRLLAAAAQALAESRLDTAKELLQVPLQASRSDAAAHALAGLIHDLEDRADAAIAEYRAALFLDPDLFQVRFLLAHRLERLGWASRARCEYRRVLTDLEGERMRALGWQLGRLLPSREAAAARCRRALERL